MAHNMPDGGAHECEQDKAPSQTMTSPRSLSPALTAPADSQLRHSVALCCAPPAHQRQRQLRLVAPARRSHRPHLGAHCAAAGRRTSRRPNRPAARRRHPAAGLDHPLVAAPAFRKESHNARCSDAHAPGPADPIAAAGPNTCDAALRRLVGIRPLLKQGHRQPAVMHTNAERIHPNAYNGPAAANARTHGK